MSVPLRLRAPWHAETSAPTPEPVTGTVARVVRPDRREDFERRAEDAMRVASDFPGHLGACPASLRRIGTDRVHRWQVATCGTRERLQGDDAPAQFVRFVGVGVITSLVYFGLFLGLRAGGEQSANLVGAVVSSMLANELHRRVTFHAGQRVSWQTAQWEGGGLAAVGLIATATALSALEGVVSDAWWAQVLLIASVTGAVGLARFVSLRVWVFSRASHRPVTAPV